MLISQDLLDILACPRCKGPVVTNNARESLDCRSCQLSYPVRDGIPVMLVDEALPLDNGGSNA